MSERKALSALGMMLAWLVVLVGCGAPSTSTETGNPPVFTISALRVAPLPDGLMVIGSPGAVDPGGSEVQVRNVENGLFGPLVTSRANGSFEAPVPGVPGDRLEVRGESRGLSSSASLPTAVDDAAGELGPDVTGQPAPPDAQGPTTTPPANRPAEDAGAAVDASARDVGRDGATVDASAAASAAENVDAGTRDSFSPLASCAQREQVAEGLLRDAYDAADRSCVFDADCTFVAPETVATCSFGCWEDTLSTAGRASFESAVQSVERDVCAAYFAAGCEPRDAEQPCLSRVEPARCSAGRCVRGGSTTAANPTVTRTSSETTSSPSGTRTTVDRSACSTRNEQARAVIAEVVADTDRSCTTASDCVRVPDITGCYQGCGLIVSRAGEQQLSEALRDIDQQLCENTPSNGCQPDLSRCNWPPPGPLCRANLCVES